MPQRKGYDAVVIGGGIVGLACAWRAALSGLSVLLVERAKPGAGASGVAAGMLAPVTEADFSEEALLALNLEGAAAWPAFEAELAEAAGDEVGLSSSGALVAAADRDDVGELRRLHDFQRSLGLTSEWVSASECRRLEPGLSPRVAGGIVAPGDCHVDPRRVIDALVTAFGRAGGELLIGTGVAGVDAEGGRVSGVRLADGSRVRSGAAVVAAGSWSGGLELPCAPPLRPVKGQILELRGPPARRLAERLVRTPRCYVVDRGDGRVAVGATVEEQGFDLRVTADAVYRLLQAAWEVLPDVLELELVAARAGLRPATPDNAPAIGAGGLEGVLWATGHYRNGVLLAPITAAAIATLLTGADPVAAAVPFSPARFDREPATVS